MQKEKKEADEELAKAVSAANDQSASLKTEIARMQKEKKEADEKSAKAAGAASEVAPLKDRLSVCTRKEGGGREACKGGQRCQRPKSS